MEWGGSGKDGELVRLCSGRREKRRRHALIHVGEIGKAHRGQADGRNEDGTLVRRHLTRQAENAQPLAGFTTSFDPLDANSYAAATLHPTEVFALVGND